MNAEKLNIPPCTRHCNDGCWYDPVPGICWVFVLVVSSNNPSFNKLLCEGRWYW